MMVRLRTVWTICICYFVSGWGLYFGGLLYSTRAIDLAQRTYDMLFVCVAVWAWSKLWRETA